MRKTLALILIIMFLIAPCLIMFKQVSVTNAATNSLVPNATLLWNYTTSNGVWSSPAVVNGVVYVGSEDVFYTGAPYGAGPQYGYAGNFYALNAANGHKLWNISIPVGTSTPAVEGGVVYVGSYDQNVYALNATNGSKLWSYVTGDLVSSSPAVAKGIVYVGLSDGDLVALNGTTGKEVWKYHSSGGVGSPVVKDGVVFDSSSAFIPIFTFTGDVYALNAANGKMLWNYSTNISVAFPTLFGETLYVGIGSNVTALNSINGSKVWSASISEQTGLAPAVLRPTAFLNDVLYVGSSDGSVSALNANSGEKIWNRFLGNSSDSSPGAVYGVTSPAVANGVVYIGSIDGNLYALNASNGEIFWNYTISDRLHALGSSPVVAYGVVYIGSGAHNVYAFSNPANHNTSFDALPILITVVIAIIIVAIAVTLMIRRSKSKSPHPIGS